MPGLRKPISLRLKPAEFSKVQDDVFGRRWIKLDELFFLIIGLILVALGVLFFLGVNPLLGKGSGWGFIIVGGPWSVLVAAKVGLRAWMSRLVPQDSVYNHIDYRSLNRSLADNKVQPKLIINGVSYFSKRDVANVNGLLRASVPPPTPKQELLRGATHDTAASASDLLHPAANEDRNASDTTAEEHYVQRTR